MLENTHSWQGRPSLLPLVARLRLSGFKPPLQRTQMVATGFTLEPSFWELYIYIYIIDGFSNII